MRKFTFQDYWDAICPRDPIGVRESILRRANEDPNIDWPEYKRLVDKAYPTI